MSAPDRTLRFIAVFFTVITAVMIAVAVAAVRNISRSALASDWVNHTHAVILEVNGAVGSLEAGDGALRTFVMTGDPRDQSACRAAFARMSEHLELARALTRREPDQGRQVARLAELAGRRADLAGRVFAARASGAASAQQVLLAGEAEAAPLAEIERAADQLTQDEMGLLAQRDTAAYLQAQATRWTVWLGVAVDICLLLGAGWLIGDDLRARRRAAALLQEANQRLEQRVRERTAELAGANEQLMGENLERKWANQALEHQLRYNQLIVNSINDGVFVLTKILNISRINPAVVHLTGWEPADLVNRPLATVVRLGREGEPKPPLDPMALALREGRDLKEQAAVLTDRQGRNSAVHLTLYPLRDRDKVVGGVVIVRLASAGR